MGLRRFLVSILMLYLVLVMTGPAGAAAFSDLAGHWSEKAVALSRSQGIVNGYPDGRFHPDELVTRAEVARMLVNAVGLAEYRRDVSGVDSVFRDVCYEHWAKADIILGREAGIISGDGDGLFRPGDYITRQELAALLVRALQFVGEVEIAAASLDFSDKDDVAGWAREYVNRAVGAGLLKGYPDGTLKPEGFTTRAEAVAVIGRLLKYTGRAFDYAGYLRGVGTNLLYVESDLGTVAFSVYEQAEFFYEDTRVGFNQLDDFSGEPVLLGLNYEGDVVFGQLGDRVELPEIPVGKRQSWARTVQQKMWQLIKDDAVTFAGTVLDEDPVLSMTASKETIGVAEFTYATGATGKGQLIAVIDTGVDVSHPDLQYISPGESKIVDWVDFTDEGRVLLEYSIRQGDALVAKEREYVIQGIPSAGGSYRYGLISEEKLGFDVNFNNSKADTYLILATDTAEAGVFDTVYVDTDDDGNLVEEQGLLVYREGYGYTWFASKREDKLFAIVISDLREDGREVKLGFDGNGHGTHVAGIAAANGKFQGVAPEARLLVIKAVDSFGQVDWDKLREAIIYAVEHGAGIINLSMGYYQDITGGRSKLTRTINQLAAEQGVIFTVASGNKGPGLSTMAVPGNAEQVISVGAYISPAMWEADFQWQVDKGTLWYFSSTGPRKDGLLLPTVVAPGSAVSTVPRWSANDYLLLEGTSMAAPHVAGAVALLLDAAARHNLEVTPEAVKEAVAHGTKEIPHLNLVEAGNGLVYLPRAWEYLKSYNGKVPLEAAVFNEIYGSGKGLYARDFIPGKIGVAVNNRGREVSRIQWTASAGWLSPLFAETVIAPGTVRHVPVRYAVPEQEGIYTALLIGDDQSTSGHDIRILNTVIKPYSISETEPLYIRDEAAAARYKRYFVRVPEGTEKLHVQLRVRPGDGKYQGRARVHLIRPNGEEVAMTDYAGNTPEGNQSRELVSAERKRPIPGVWEIVVYSSATLSFYGQDFSSYELQVSVEEGEQETVAELQSQLVIGAVPGISGKEYTGLLHLTVLDFNTKSPYNGMLEVNGRLYEVRGGELVIPANAGKIDVKI